MLRIYRIKGDSMLPTMKEGDFVIALTHFYTPKVNQLVVAQHSELGVLVKRIKSFVNDEYHLVGDAVPASTSTEKMGAFKRKDILGKVLYISRK